MMAIPKNKRGRLRVLQTSLYLILSVLMFSAITWGDITGRIQSVEGKTVRIVMEGAVVPEIGAKVKISDEVSGVGLVPLIGTWKVAAVEGDVVVAVTKDMECGTPLPGYTATISGTGGGPVKLPPDTGPPPAKTKPPPEVKRRPVIGGAGPGPIAKVKATGPYIILLALAMGIIILAVSISVLRRAEGGQKGKVRAVLDVYYADGGQKTFIIKGERTNIGRGKNNDLILNDSKVSSRHAEIVATMEGFVLNDLGSINGTFLNEENISDTLIYAGDKIRMGSTTLHFKS